MDSENFGFTTCSFPECSNWSGFSEYYSTTLRAGFDTCTNHTTTDSVASRSETLELTENATFIFYDIEISSKDEIEQLSAVTVDKEHIDLVIKTSSNKNNSPLISKFRPTVYMLMAVEPWVAKERFVLWVNMVMSRETKGTGHESDVVLVAHNGMLHKTMMICEINPPKWRLTDSLLIFKILMPSHPDEDLKLSNLAKVYTPWYIHFPHDGLSDAIALKHVIMATGDTWQQTCYVFSSAFEYFIMAVGLNTLEVRTPPPLMTIRS